MENFVLPLNSKAAVKVRSELLLLGRRLYSINFVTCLFLAIFALHSLWLSTFSNGSQACDNSFSSHTSGL